jgi:hypothetical protein
MSGWATLAAAYPAGEVLSPNTRWRWQSALMNANTKYNASLTVIADPQAVHLSVLAPLSVGHRPSPCRGRIFTPRCASYS